MNSLIKGFVPNSQKLVAVYNAVVVDQHVNHPVPVVKFPVVGFGTNGVNGVYRAIICNSEGTLKFFDEEPGFLEIRHCV